MLVATAFAAIVMFAAQDTTQSGSPAAEAKPAAEAEKAKPTRTCYSSTPSGSRMPRKTCVVEGAKAEPKSVQAPKEESKSE